MAKKLEKVDVVVVGSGWAGGIVSAELSKAGYKVVMLERGKDQTRSDFIGVKDELRYTNRHEMIEKLTGDTITSRVSIGDAALPVRLQKDMNTGTDLGGGSMHWAGSVYRWRSYDFEIRSKTIERYGEGKIPEGMQIRDWGITYDELEPYYAKWEQTAGISGEPDPLGDKRSNEYPNPPMLASPAIKLFKESAKEIGLHPYQMASGNMSQTYTNPDGETLNQCMFCSFCTMYGCDFGSKSDPLATVIPTARKTGNCEIRTNSLVRRVIHKDGKATGVLYTDTRTGQEFEQPADVVVLAAFTFSNNRLLMLSDIGEIYNPETRKGTIGRNFTGQFNSTFLGATGFFNDKKFNYYMGAGGLGGAVSDYDADLFDHTDLDFIHGGGIELRQYGDAAIKNNFVPKGTPTWGEEFKEKSLFYAFRTLTVWYSAAVMPWWHNFMDLDPTYKDEFGDPLLRITNKLTEQDKNIAKFGIEKCTEIVEAMGADIIDQDELPDQFDHAYEGMHYIGGVAMGEDPETSAVNNYLQLWEMENLFVVGGSALPHFSSHHPTPTIGALSYRAAEGIEKYLKENGGLLTKPKSSSVKA
ncbi:GMC family oxidoreductase [Sporosarcina sp. P16a]|uniref:GMC family oxidoreductase n=1 Tax=unclassified Sporosarcina TaxID=2647733 RepID=UPI000C16A470|nr:MULTISPECIES: GMC family oxidoreductase [unclassified Sporosarcina]PIC67898.1 GMC family oxidoreductase [Sporosarcina sp. P16a]PIC83891.1 GMC family oxidoreductase [Sporosarcina sp. P1]PIC93522.1 GMC family oxidoreductase [Sporosarcina sp. P25]